MSETRGLTRILIVLSGDYGDLGMADYLAAGQGFSESVVFLVPERLRDVASSSDRIVRTYSRIEQIVEVAKELSPRVVMLFSAYLFAADRLFSLSPFIPSLAQVKGLLKHLRTAGCAVATNDPFCGLAAHVTPRSFDFVTSGLFDRSRRKGWLVAIRRLMTFAHCRRVHRVLRKLPHVYAGAAPANLEKRKLLTFYNADFACDTGSAGLGSHARDGGTGDAPTWLFVLAEIDLMIQQNLHGDSLAAMVSSRLADAASQGRTPILIAPARLVAQVRRQIAPSVDAVLLERLPYKQFVSTLLRAEYAFYWNVFSFSILLRLMHGRPVFFFDKGHMARIVRGYYAAAVACYFDGFEPIFVDLGERLTLCRLESLARQFAEYAARVMAKLQSAPSPTQMLEELVAVGRN